MTQNELKTVVIQSYSKTFKKSLVDSADYVENVGVLDVILKLFDKSYSNIKLLEVYYIIQNNNH